MAGPMGGPVGDDTDVEVDVPGSSLISTFGMAILLVPGMERVLPEGGPSGCELAFFASMNQGSRVRCAAILLILEMFAMPWIFCDLVRRSSLLAIMSC